jgi:hypothetical protein
MGLRHTLILLYWEEQWQMNMGRLERELEVGTWPPRNEVGVTEEAKGEEERRFRHGTYTKPYFCPFCRTPLEGHFGSLR